MEEEYNTANLQMQGLSLIDYSLENDPLVLNNSSSSPLLNHKSSEKQKGSEIFEALGSLSAGKEAAMTPSSDPDDQLPDLNESLEPDRARGKGKYNLRKSLAWDSAFFTSAGVLDPEELSCMIKEADSNVKQKLPGIEEDVQRSIDSMSTLESENMTLENLEAELFEDIRASIQKSSKAYNAMNSNCKVKAGESQEITSMKTDLTSQNQKPVLKKPGVISKSQIKQTLRKLGAVKAAKHDSTQVAQPVVRTGNSNVTLTKPPMVINKGKSISTATPKRASLTASQVNKYGNEKTTIEAGKGPQTLKTPVISGARRVLSKSSSSSNSAYAGSLNSTKTKSATSSLTDSSGSVSSVSVSKSHLSTVRRKIGERTVNVPPSISTLKMPSKTAASNRTISGNSAISAYLMSSKISSSVSPASSISEWSSASSSSSCAMNQMSNKSRASFDASIDASSCRSLDNETICSDLNNHSIGHILEEHGNDGIAIQNQSTRKSSTQLGTLSHPAPVRPSGLRLPSPKIGFFDGVKSVRTPNGTMRTHASLAVLPKVEAAIPSPNRISNMKPKIVKLSHCRTVSALAKAGPKEPNTTPVLIEENSLATSGVEGGPLSSLAAIDEISGESCLKVVKIRGNGSHQANRVAADAFGTVIEGNNGVPLLQESERSLNMDEIASSKTNKIFADSDACDPEIGCNGILKPSKKVGKGARDGQDELASILPTLLRTDEKENTVFAENVDKVNTNQAP